MEILIFKQDNKLNLVPFDGDGSKQGLVQGEVEKGAQFITQLSDLEFGEMVDQFSELTGKEVSRLSGRSSDEGDQNYMVTIEETFRKKIWVAASDEERAKEFVRASFIPFSNADYVAESTDISVD